MLKHQPPKDVHWFVEMTECIFPSVAVFSVPFNIHSDFTNQTKSNVKDGTVNDHQLKPS